VPGDHCRDRGAAAAERHVNEVEAERQAELFAGEMRLRACPRRAEAVFAGIGLDELDQLLDRLRRHGGVDGDDGGGRDGEGDGFEVVNRVVGQAREQRRIDHMGAEREQDCVAVGRRFRHLGSADIAGGARDVLDIDLLAELLGKLLRHEPREGVGHPTRRKGHDRAHRPGRIGLRPCSTRHARERGSGRGQMQKFAAGKFHHLPTATSALIGAELGTKATLVSH